MHSFEKAHQKSSHQNKWFESHYLETSVVYKLAPKWFESHYLETSVVYKLKPKMARALFRDEWNKAGNFKG